MRRAILFIVFVLICKHVSAIEGTHWATADNRLVTVDQLSDERMLFYVENLTKAQLADCPKFLAELRKRKLALDQIPEIVNQTTDTKRELPTIRPNEPSQSEKQSVEPNSNVEEAVLQLSAKLKRVAVSGLSRMKQNQRTVAIYRNLKAHDPIGNLQAVENLSIETKALLIKMWDLGHALQRFPNPTYERLDYYKKRAVALAKEIDKNERVINYERDRFGMRPKPIKRKN